MTIIYVDPEEAKSILECELNKICGNPVRTCTIKDAIDTVLNGRYCLTYQYIMLTALTAKATNPDIDILTMQTDDHNSTGLWSSRTLCKDVVYPFQKEKLGDIIDGANNDPLVNKPGRYPRIDMSNKARGDSKAALEALCSSLPTIKTQEAAIECIDYILTELNTRKEVAETKLEEITNTILGSKSADLYEFLDRLLNMNFGGDALLLAASCLARIQFHDADGYKVVPHPVNQSGASSQQFSDLDIFFEGLPFLGIELKDKAFVLDDVKRAVDTAIRGSASGLLFIAGRGADFSREKRLECQQIRDYAAKKGAYLGICHIDDFMDIVLSVNSDIDPSAELMGIYSQTISNASTSECREWVYKNLTAQ